MTSTDKHVELYDDVFDDDLILFVNFEIEGCSNLVKICKKSLLGLAVCDGITSMLLAEFLIAWLDCQACLCTERYLFCTHSAGLDTP